MICWRVCREPFADLTGEGARLHGGRWNTPGRPLVYTADNAALALLEVRVHLDLPPDLVPVDYVLLAIETGDAAVELCTEVPIDPVSLSDEWLRGLRSPILRVPSFIVPECFNLLINPRHPGSSSISITSKRPFRFDERLWPAT